MMLNMDPDDIRAQLKNIGIRILTDILICIAIGL